jgi:transcriptional regulator of acetoin/glycerol metabolism
MRTLLAYAWPGNVRQLFSVLESATVRSGWSAIHAQHLPPEVLPQGTDGPDSGRERYRAGGAGIEREAIVQALRQADGVRARAAQLLGMGRTTLWRKMKEHGLDD